MRIKTIALGAAALLVLAGPAGALLAENGTVTGGGFTREGKGKGSVKKMLTIQATDGETDSGRAQYKETSPGTGTPLTVRVELDCVVVDENHAYASGPASSNDEEWDGETALIRIEDNGSGKKGGDRYGIERAGLFTFIEQLLQGNCGAGDVATDRINGGNFQVTPAN